MRKLFILLLFTTFAFSQTGILTPVDRLRIKTPQELSSNTQVVTRSTATGETGYVLKTDLVDYLEFSTASALPVSGVVGKLYLTKDDNKLYRFNGTIYLEVSAGGGGGGGVSSVSATDATGIDFTVTNPTTTPNISLALTSAAVGLGNVDNTTDLNKPISTATQTALNAKQATLVSTTNIKTINGQSVLGSGDLTVAGAGSGANLSYTASASNGIIVSDTGSDATVPLVDGSNAGLASPSMKSTWDAKLSSITSGNVTTALGFTPYNATNPEGYITSSSLFPFLLSSTAASTYLPISGGTATGPFTNNSSSTWFDFRGNSNSNSYGLFRNSAGSVLGYIGGADSSPMPNSDAGSFGIKSNSILYLESDSNIVRMPHLAGTGSRMVVTDASGNLTATTLPAGAQNLQQVTNIGASTTNGITITTTGTAVPLLIQADLAQGVYSTSTASNGVYGGSGSSYGIYGTSLSSNAAAFNLAPGNTSDIVVFLKNGSNQASVSHDGKITANVFISNGTIRLKNYTVSTLPSGTQGDTAYVTDASSPTYLTTVSGGGSVVCPVFYNGSNWVCH